MTAILERRKQRNALRRASRRHVSDGFEAWLDSAGATTLGSLNEAFGEKILAAACLALMAPSALPIPSGGATHVLDVIAVVFAVQIMLARQTVWMPASWRAKELGKKSEKALRLLIRFIRWCERFSRRRMAHFMTGRAGEITVGAAISLFVLGAFVSPPFSGLDTLPALAVVLLALGLLLEDVAFAIVGLVVGVLGVGLTITFGVQAVHLVERTFS